MTLPEEKEQHKIKETLTFDEQDATRLPTTNPSHATSLSSSKGRHVKPERPLNFEGSGKAYDVSNEESPLVTLFSRQ
ncbi:hypothetical protein E4U45_000217 [Claviceps purpurea]|nr:hypothetical protein E4U45_000217 [Claviceps purpurea]